MRSRHLITILGTLVLGLSVATPAYAAEFRTGDSLSIDQNIERDTFLAGSTVNANKSITGELFAAGNTVTVKEKMTRSAFVAGNTLKIEKGTGYNLFAAGNTIDIAGEYGNSVYIAGNLITLDSGTVINGDLHIAGSTVKLAGQVKGHVFVTAESIESDMVIGGNFSATASKVTFNGGSIAGNFKYRSDVDATGLDKVDIKGDTTRQDLPKQERGGYATSIIYTFLSAIVFGAILVLMFPRRLNRYLDVMTDEYGPSFGIGIATLFAMPLLFILLVSTVIGMKVGFFLLLSYIPILILASVVGLFYAGHYLLAYTFPSRKDDLWAQLGMGAVVLYLVRFVPIVAGIVGLVLFLLVYVPTLGALVKMILLPEKREHPKGK